MVLTRRCDLVKRAQYQRRAKGGKYVPVIETVLEGTAAEKAGLEVGDVIIGIDDQPIVSADDLQRHASGIRVAFEVFADQSQGVRNRRHQPELRAALTGGLHQGFECAEYRYGELLAGNVNGASEQ